MKSLSGPELVSFCEWLRECLQLAQLQDLWTDGKFFVLQLYLRQEIFVVVDLQPNAPMLWMQENKPKVAKSPKPTSLFMASHGKGKVLKDIHVLLDRGRSLLFIFESRGDVCELQIDLIPKNPNLMVTANGKSLFWNKPRELPTAQMPELEKIDIDWRAWCRDIEQKKFSKPTASSGSSASSSGSFERTLEKKQKALDALRLQLDSQESERYRALGEALKVSSTAPDEFRDLFDDKKSVAENREKAFQKSKDLIRKKEGTRDRIALIEKEIVEIQCKIEKGELPSSKPVSMASKLMKKGEAQGRKISLEGGFEAALGKSGADNLALLRQARAWDFWIHLKDEPGAHAILFRERNKEVPEAAIRQVAEWVWQQSKGKKAMPGLKYQVLVVECRFVKPIKGDRLGRVNYSNPRVYTFASKPTS